MSDILEEGISRLAGGSPQCRALRLSARQREQLELYSSCVLEFNKTYNLMKAASRDDFIARHVLDSLAGAPCIERLSEGLAGCTVGDIGSGGGCPGIPLAVAFPAHRFVLLERMEKRCSFLESAIRKCGIENTRVMECRAEDALPALFDIEVIRAFHPLDARVAETLFRMLKECGTLVSYKGRRERVESEMTASRDFILRYTRCGLEVPFLEEHERCLVVIRKADFSPKGIPGGGRAPRGRC